MTTPPIDTKALRELQDAACDESLSLFEKAQAYQRWLKAVTEAAPALLDLADRAQEQARECASNLRSLRASQEECHSLYEEREDLLKSRDRVIAERNEQSGLRDKLIERLTASDKTWSEALGNERKLRDAAEREAERLREALDDIASVVAAEPRNGDYLPRIVMGSGTLAVHRKVKDSTVAALRGEEAPRGE